MMNSMEEMLSLEVKREIAERYFGFRKMIEDDSQLYNEHVHAAYRQLENEVGFDLVRLYILLHREALIRDFFRITGFRDAIFLDPYLLQSAPIRRRLFKGQLIHGFTRHLRFNHLFFDIYLRLEQGLENYASTLNQLAGEGKAIVEEIEVFQRKNDLGSMMSFLRRLDSSDGDSMSGELSPMRDTYLEDKMRIQAPSGAEALLPAFPLLPPLKTCKGELTDLLDKAYAQQNQPEVRDYCR
ncbi:MAG: hypothetical protein AB7E77_09505 [Desulfobulbus sp.]